MSHGYKVGDRVISLSEPVMSLSGPKMFAKATVCCVDEPLPAGLKIGIAFDEPIGIHDCEGHCESGHGYWIGASNLIPEPSKKASEREYIQL